MSGIKSTKELVRLLEAKVGHLKSDNIKERAESDRLVHELVQLKRDYESMESKHLITLSDFHRVSAKLNKILDAVK